MRQSLPLNILLALAACSVVGYLRCRSYASLTLIPKPSSVSKEMADFSSSGCQMGFTGVICCRQFYSLPRVVKMVTVKVLTFLKPSFKKPGFNSLGVKLFKYIQCNYSFINIFVLGGWGFGLGNFWVWPQSS